MALYANAREFLLAVQERYRALSTYSDRGLVKSYSSRPTKALHREMQRFPGSPADSKRSFEDVLRSYRDARKRLGGRPLSELPFETALQRPDRFRFAWARSHPYPPLRHRKMHAVLGCDDKGMFEYRRSYGGQETLERGMTLESAIAGATGVSHGAAHTIGTLLFEDCDGTRLVDLRRPRFRGRREFDGVLCVAVTGFDHRGGRITAWFGIQDLLLRRVLEGRHGSEELRFDVRASRIDASIRFEAPVVSSSRAPR